MVSPTKRTTDRYHTVPDITMPVRKRAKQNSRSSEATTSESWQALITGIRQEYMEREARLNAEKDELKAELNQVKIEAQKDKARLEQQNDALGHQVSNLHKILERFSEQGNEAQKDKARLEKQNDALGHQVSNLHKILERFSEQGNHGHQGPDHLSLKEYHREASHAEAKLTLPFASFSGGTSSEDIYSLDPASEPPSSMDP